MADESFNIVEAEEMEDILVGVGENLQDGHRSSSYDEDEADGSEDEELDQALYNMSGYKMLWSPTGDVPVCPWFEICLKPQERDLSEVMKGGNKVRIYSFIDFDNTDSMIRQINDVDKQCEYLVIGFTFRGAEKYRRRDPQLSHDTPPAGRVSKDGWIAFRKKTRDLCLVVMHAHNKQVYGLTHTKESTTLPSPYKVDINDVFIFADLSEESPPSKIQRELVYYGRLHHWTRHIEKVLDKVEHGQRLPPLQYQQHGPPIRPPNRLSQTGNDVDLKTTSQHVSSVDATRVICSRCGDEGHLIFDCGEERCGNCADFGHIAKYCVKQSLGFSDKKRLEKSESEFQKLKETARASTKEQKQQALRHEVGSSLVYVDEHLSESSSDELSLAEGACERCKEHGHISTDCKKMLCQNCFQFGHNEEKCGNQRVMGYGRYAAMNREHQFRLEKEDTTAEERAEPSTTGDKGKLSRNFEGFNDVDGGMPPTKDIGRTLAMESPKSKATAGVPSLPFTIPKRHINQKNAVNLVQDLQQQLSSLKEAIEKKVTNPRMKKQQTEVRDSIMRDIVSKSTLLNTALTVEVDIHSPAAAKLQMLWGAIDDLKGDWDDDNVNAVLVIMQESAIELSKQCS